MAHKPHIPKTTYQNDLMLQTKHNLPFGSREENFMGFYNIWARCPFWSSNLKQKVPYTKSQYSFKFALKSSYIQESPMALDRSPESWHLMYWSVAKEI